MEVIRVDGGARLVGEVPVPGAKNSALKLMAATLLAPGRSVLHDVPDILDVAIMAELLRRLGCTVDHSASGHHVAIDVPQEVGHRADYELVRAMRASISVLGPLLTRTGSVDVALPGGDAIGSRGLDLHAEGLRALGAVVDVDHGYLRARAPHGLTGTLVPLAFPSVGATENLLMAAVLASGTTVLENVAREPEIVDLTEMLIEMGARIDGTGTSQLSITGVHRLQPVEHRVVPDRIVAGTFAYAAAVTGGDVHLRGARPAHLSTAIDKLSGLGVELVDTGNGLRVRGPRRPQRLQAIDVATLPHPGFPTDLQPFALVASAVAQGSAVITENLFEARFRFAQELSRLGADVHIDGHHVLVRGRERLSGAPVQASDIRAGAALVVAGLVADGVTEVGGVQHIDRGYEAFASHLADLGAQIERVDVASPGLPLQS